MSDKAEFKIYQADDGWRWKLVANNNEIMASGEAYTTLAHADRAVATIIKEASQTFFDREQFLLLRQNHWDQIKKRIEIGASSDMIITMIEEARL